MTKLWNIITADGSRKPYGMTESLELAGKIPEESKAVKCDDDIFLVMVKDGLKVYSTGTGQFAEPDSFPVTDAADGFKTEISLAPEVILPTEVNGKKIEKLYLKDLDFSNNTILNKAPVIIIPEGIEVADKNWKNYDTSIKALYLLYPSGEKEALIANDIYNTPFSYLYDTENDDYYLSVNVSCMSLENLPTEFNGKKVSKIDLEHVYYSDGYENADLSLNIPEGISIVNKHWKGAVTGIAEITLKYPSGETEVLRSDDYDELVEKTKASLRDFNYDENYLEENLKKELCSFIIYQPDHRCTNYPSEDIGESGNNEEDRKSDEDGIIRYDRILFAE